MKLTGTQLRLSATDLANFLGCRHCTRLDRDLERDLRAKPRFSNPALRAIEERGLRHEAAYLENLRATKTVAELAGSKSHSRERVIELMTVGADVIPQATMSSGRWLGYADFLVKVGGSSRFGAWAYQAHDTKLARETKAGAVLQLALYSDILEEMQGCRPQFLKVVTPGELGIGFTVHEHAFDDYRAYYLAVRRRFERAVDADAMADTKAEPVPKCESCRWRLDCEDDMRKVDHASFIARSTKGQRDELAKQGMETLTAVAGEATPLQWMPARGSRDSLCAVVQQAAIQLASSGLPVPAHDFLESQTGRGLSRLPEPNEGDIFFDFEGDPFVPGGGLEYLFGYTLADGGDYAGEWAFDHASEKRVFAKFVADLMERWRRYPAMHVYHYAPYEPSAMKRLMLRHAICGAEVDQMLRSGLFVDLYAVVREGLRVGVESYSIKKLEACFSFERELKLDDLGASKRALEAALELTNGGDSEIDPKWKEAVKAYNRDDCRSAMALRKWLEGLRAKRIADGIEIIRPAPVDEEKAKQESATDQQGRVLRGRLLERAAAEEDASVRTALTLLANVVEFHNREDKVVWHDLFRLHALSIEELELEPHALSGLERMPAEAGDKATVERYTYPPQVFDVRDDSEVYDVDANHERPHSIASVTKVDRANRTLTITWVGTAERVQLRSVYFHQYIGPGTIREALFALVDHAAANGLSDTFAVARDLLLQHPPRLRTGAFERTTSEATTDYAVRVAKDLDGGLLPIQGPPGAGKTFTAAHMIVALAKAGYTVGVTGTSYKVVANVLDKVVQVDSTVTCFSKVKKTNKARVGVKETTTSKTMLKDLTQRGHQVYGGLAWQWTSEVALANKVDYLFIDEAGQFSLANALAVSSCAKNVVLLGDPQQLEQPSRAAHPDGAGVSALEHIIGERQTIADNAGIFLNETWRLHPEIQAFTSPMFYDGILDARPELAGLRISTPVVRECGLYKVDVPHDECRNESEAEVTAIAALVERLLSADSTWTDMHGSTHRLNLSDVLVVAPYNAQVSRLKEALPEDARVGTVDKFQGQEAPVVIISMTSSSVALAPRGFDFLLSPNRINVATSRAKCACLLVANPSLFAVDCRTPLQMKHANTLCHYDSLSRTVD